MPIKSWQHVRRILTVRLDNLGDVLVTTPALHAIKQCFPQAELTLLASPVGAQVGRLNPDIDRVIVYDAPWMDPWHKLPLDSTREQRMIAQLKAEAFDAAVIFTSFRQSPLPSAYLCYLADIPLRAAASIDGPGSLLTTRHKHPDTLMHEVERGLDLVAALGITTDDQALVLRVPSEGYAQWQAIKQEVWSDAQTTDPRSQSPCIVVHPGCTMAARTYPWEMFAAVVQQAVEQLNATVFLTGTADEMALVAQIMAQLSPVVRERVVSLAGRLPFPGFCALIEQADLVITNNTGPMHLAAALHTPVVALFALTNPPEQWGPWRVPQRVLFHDVSCRICYSRVCPVGHECLRLVTPSLVVAAVRSLLMETRPLTTSQQDQTAHPRTVVD